MKSPALTRATAIKALLVSPGAGELAAARELAAELVELLEGVSIAAAPPADVGLAFAPRSGGESPPSPAAARQRRRRRRQASEQLELLGVTGVTSVTPPVTDVTPSVTDVTPVTLGAAPQDSAANTTGTASALSDPPPDPDLKSGRKDPGPGRTRVTRHAVVHDREAPPEWFLDDTSAQRPDLSEWDVRELWRRFATLRPTHASEADARDHVGKWLPGHRADLARARVVRAARTGEIEDEPPPPPPCATDDVAGDDAPLSPETLRELAKAKLRELGARLDREATGPPGKASAAS